MTFFFFTYALGHCALIERDRERERGEIKNRRKLQMVPPAWITKQSLAAQGICALVQVPVRSPYLNTTNVASGILFV